MVWGNNHKIKYRAKTELSVICVKEYVLAIKFHSFHCILTKALRILQRGTCVRLDLDSSLGFYNTNVFTCFYFIAFDLWLVVFQYNRHIYLFRRTE